jgi:tRNA threonylcarbamoyladenosine biosynthesis protein TsaB
LLILACDTSTDYATFALGNDNGLLLNSVTFKHHRDLSQRFYELLQQLLAEGDKKLADIDILAVGIGPGSFTGVRVAVTTMKTIAQAASKKLVSVGTLAAYAHAVAPASGETIVAILPSRKGEIYYQIFTSGSAGTAAVASYDKLESILTGTEGPVILCGQTTSLPQQFSTYKTVLQAAVPAASLITLAAQKIKNNDYADPIKLTPVYAALPAISQHKSR